MGRNVDFVLVDGDHSARGVRQDIEDILSSDAVRGSVIVLDDTMNDVVREGINSVDYARYDKVAVVDLDFVPGYLARSEPYRLQLWGGLGLIVVDADHRLGHGGDVRNRRFHDLASLVRPARDDMSAIESGGIALDALDPDEVESVLRKRWDGGAVDGARAAASAEDEARLRAELAQSNARLARLEHSLSWRVTAPLRSLKRQWHGCCTRRSAR